MCLLERWFGCAAEGAPAAARKAESSEARHDSIRLRVGLSVLCQRVHPGRVIETSDVRGNERWKHYRTVSTAAKRYRRTGPPDSDRALEFEACGNAFSRASA